MVAQKRTKNKIRIFVDSDAFVALIKEDDSNHTKAQNILNGILQTHDAIFITSNYVFSEVVTVISQRIGHEEAVHFIETITTPDYYIEMKRISKELEQMAIDFFKKQTSKNVSFVDCTNMAVMTSYQIDDVFSFDSVYKTNGFNNLG